MRGQVQKVNKRGTRVNCMTLIQMCSYPFYRWVERSWSFSLILFTTGKPYYQALQIFNAGVTANSEVQRFLQYLRSVRATLQNFSIPSKSISAGCCNPALRDLQYIYSFIISVPLLSIQKWKCWLTCPEPNNIMMTNVFLVSIAIALMTWKWKTKRFGKYYFVICEFSYIGLFNLHFY